MFTKINDKISLIKKINEYRIDKIKAGEIMPYSKNGMVVSAILNYLVYGTSFSEYFAYRFYALNHNEKKTFMTRRFMFDFFDKYNPKELRKRIGDKRITSQYYGILMNRDQYHYEEGLEAFLKFSKVHQKIFIKRGVSWGGDGTRPADVSTKEKALDVYKTIGADVIVEPYLENHKILKEIYPGSLNTIKITTLYLSDGPHIQTALFRCGNNSTVDNVHLGGICALVDLKSGVVFGKAVDKHFKQYVIHPITHKQIIGLRIPMWTEVKELALKAARVTPEMKYSSWDIAVTPNGPVMIEGNWDAEFYAEQMLMQQGNRKRYEKKLTQK